MPNNTPSRHLLWYALLAGVLLVGAALRLLVWHWHTYYPLGGDEQEYLNQALVLLREHRYTELRFMRPPLYGVFLAGSILLVDSLVQQLRLVQVVISTLTIIPMWLLTQELTNRENEHSLPTPPAPSRIKGEGDKTLHATSHRYPFPSLWEAGREGSPKHAATLAALLCAVNYTLADYATELLTETVFLFGLTLLLWLLLRTARVSHWGMALVTGLVLGLLCLVRSVALPLLLLGAGWLLLQRWGEWRRSVVLSSVFVAGALLVIMPWTIRNTTTYGGVILIDTTGAENLWLDNAPQGRESVKAQLYAMGEDRLARQQIAMQNGTEAILAAPSRFVAKAWGELLKLVALEYTDDMLDRRAIWVPTAEVWVRLLAGDLLFVMIVVGGTAGLLGFGVRGKKGLLPLSPRWLLLPWVLYIVLTALVFHVELRYRLPLFPVLLPYTAIFLTSVWRVLSPHTPTPLPKQERATTDSLPPIVGCAVGDGGTAPEPSPPTPSPIKDEGETSPESMLRLYKRNYAYGTQGGLWRMVPVLAILLLMLLHKPYPLLAWQLGNKHLHLAQAQSALEQGNTTAATANATQALAYDAESVLARVALAQAQRLDQREQQAEQTLREAIAILPAHPLPHLLLGDVLRLAGRSAEAQAEFAYETATLQDVQMWLWERTHTPPPAMLDVGNGLDLGYIHEFTAALPDTHWRWTTGYAQVRLAPPAATSPATLTLRLASGRSSPVPPTTVVVTLPSGQQQSLAVGAGWQEYAVPLGKDDAAAAQQSGALVVTLDSATFTPREDDPTSDDGRVLGVMVDWVGLRRYLADQ